MAEQNLITFEKALKEGYLPAWQNQLGIEPSALLGKVKKVPLTNNIIVATAPIGLSGGFGFSEEGENTPVSGNVNFERFRTTAKDMYVDISISQKAMMLTGSAGAMVNALDAEVKSAYETAKWHVGRSLFGNGDGVLAKLASQASDTTTITVDSVRNLKEGIIIDIYASGAEKGATPTVSGARIRSVNRTSKQIVLDKAVSAASGSLIATQFSYKREITGLGAIFDDSITTLYDVNKAANPFIQPIVVDANHDIADSVITGALRQSSRDKGGKVDLIMAGDTAYDTYTDYLRSNNYRVEQMTHELKGGFKAIRFIFGNREVDIVNEQFVPDTEMWGVDTGATEFHSYEWNFASHKGGDIFTLMENKSVYRALLCNYGNLVVTNPGACIRITNVDTV